MCEQMDKNPRNFNKIREQFLRHLSASGNVSQLSKEFGGLDSNCERVDFVINLVQSSSLTMDFYQDSKCNETAIKFREKGNEMFKTKNLKDAWAFYTKSISYAEENSESLALAYANRSAVLFELNLNESCLMDIDRALQGNYPEHLKLKLATRQNNARNAERESFKKPYEHIPSTAKTNSRIDCAGDCIKIEESENFGRFVVAARDIEFGEILAVEQPFALLLVNQTLCHCHECIKLCYSLIPCKRCTQAMYCSESCRERAFRNYHKYECAVLKTLNILDFGKLKLLPLKIALSIKDEYNNIPNLKLDEGPYKSGRYREIHHLVANTEKRSVSDLFERALAAAVIFNLVKNHTDFFNGATINQEQIFKDILLLHMQTGPSNFHEISELAPNSSGTFEPEEIASGAFAFLSLLNHSCCPNVVRFCYGATIVLRAVKHIKKGEQCFDNYGYHYALMERSDRQKHLKDQYYFNCICKACENDWPLYDDLSECCDAEVEDAIKKLWGGDVDTAAALLQDMAHKMQRLQNEEPSKKVFQMQEIVKQCFALLGNKRRML